MGRFPVLSDQDNKVSQIERKTERVFEAAMREVARAREQIRRAEDALDHSEISRRRRSRRTPTAR